ncbi:MAG: class I SAM-dependent rRNA methyltransferase [Deltaproteobacteria bacterium]|nr:class I SAM-dependent rRNA methyltransferase [Deltaproteobacteria bacterium]
MKRGRPGWSKEVRVLSGGWDGHELVDSGGRRKLERFGEILVVRSEPKAWWNPALPAEVWDRAVAEHDDSAWRLKPGLAREWVLGFRSLRLEARFTETSKHVGVFPEQYGHWTWIEERARSVGGSRDLTLLNLFGYTGAASLAAARCGFLVTHVDASRPALAWARRNQELSGLVETPIRWILDDALKFAAREVRRGRKYDAILLDPPSFGRGPKNETWKAERHLTELLAVCRSLLSRRPVLFLLTMYNIEASSLMLGNLLCDGLDGFGGTVETGELVLPHAGSDRVLPLSIFGRWSI